MSDLLEMYGKDKAASDMLVTKIAVMLEGNSNGTVAMALTMLVQMVIVKNEVENQTGTITLETFLMATRKICEISLEHIHKLKDSGTDLDDLIKSVVH